MRTIELRKELFRDYPDQMSRSWTKNELRMAYDVSEGAWKGWFKKYGLSSPGNALTPNQLLEFIEVLGIPPTWK